TMAHSKPAVNTACSAASIRSPLAWPGLGCSPSPCPGAHTEVALTNSTLCTPAVFASWHSRAMAAG
ncbi:hypothetical protein, partial [Escherichia coli]